MSTRALYTFRSQDGDEEYHVYKHHDGYPMGAAAALTRALAFAWSLPRYEADEFAAAFVAANKSHFINTELELLRELEKRPTAKRRAEIAADLERTRRYAKDCGGGGVRLCMSGSFEDIAPQDLEYRYVISPLASGILLVTCYAVQHRDENEYIEGKSTVDGRHTWKQRKRPKAQQGWFQAKLFSAPLKSGETLTKVAEACGEVGTRDLSFSRIEGRAKAAA